VRLLGRPSDGQVNEGRAVVVTEHDVLLGYRLRLFALGDELENVSKACALTGCIVRPSTAGWARSAAGGSSRCGSVSVGGRAYVIDVRGRCSLRWATAPVAGVRAQHPLKFGVRGFARRGAAGLGRIVLRMTRHEIEPESWWIRLARAMGPGLYAFGVFASMPSHRTTMWPGTAAATARRGTSVGSRRG
jgi:hypothetical protein